MASTSKVANLTQNAAESLRKEELRTPRTGTENQKGRASNQVGSEGQSYIYAINRDDRPEIHHEAQSISSSISDVMPVSKEESSANQEGNARPGAASPNDDGAITPKSSLPTRSLLISSTTYQTLQFILFHRMGNLGAKIVDETDESPIAFISMLGVVTIGIALSSDKYNQFWKSDRVASQGSFMQKCIDQLVFLNALGFMSMLAPWYTLLKAGFW